MNDLADSRRMFATPTMSAGKIDTASTEEPLMTNATEVTEGMLIEDGQSEDQEVDQPFDLPDPDQEEEIKNDLTEEQQQAEDSCVLPTHVYVSFYDRTFGNKILYIFYKFFRILLVSFWFYFVPFVAMFASYVIPHYFRHKQME